MYHNIQGNLDTQTGVQRSVESNPREKVPDIAVAIVDVYHKLAVQYLYSIGFQRRAAR